MPVKLKTLRTARGMTLRELARAAGLAHTTLARIEAGERSPTLETLEKIARALGCTVRDLIENGEAKGEGKP